MAQESADSTPSLEPQIVQKSADQTLLWSLDGAGKR